MSDADVWQSMAGTFDSGRKQAIVKGLRLLELCEDAARVIPDPNVRNLVTSVQSEVEQELSKAAGRAIRLELVDAPTDEQETATRRAATPEPTQPQAPTIQSVENHPLVEKVKQTFDARISDVRAKRR